LPTKLVSTATFLEGSKKNNFRSFIHGQSSSANPAKFVKIGPVDVGVIEITKIYMIKHKPLACAERVG